MRKFRIAIAASILLLAGMVGWLATEINRSQRNLSDQPFGVAFALTGQDEQPITEQALRGRPALIFFGFTHCPEICPTTLYEMDGWLKEADPAGDKVRAFFVTVDPERDTPEVLAEYVPAMSDRVFGITGEPAEIERVLKGYRVYARRVPTEDGEYTMDHTAAVYLLDGQGRFRGTISYGEEAESAISKIRDLIGKG
ncbi:SCO family protein [Rhizobiaceae bacterium BDR2-2]|uniref:SCO family protein n=1 Tax=Ectorhizobium quercum TaxID=2965071 RepID=A0AAE3SV01_9HYPH|nr:SCO family protein [Ectorhizobium quercum]MCX8996444.1 SCO family protein [Ectorhizobium quercum]